MLIRSASAIKPVVWTESVSGDKCEGREKFKQNVLIKFNGRLKITLSVDGGLFSRSGLGTVI